MTATAAQHAAHLDDEQAAGDERDRLDALLGDLPRTPPPSPEDEEQFPEDHERTAAMNPGPRPITVRVPEHVRAGTQVREHPRSTHAGCTHPTAGATGREARRRCRATRPNPDGTAA